MHILLSHLSLLSADAQENCQWPQQLILMQLALEPILGGPNVTIGRLWHYLRPLQSGSSIDPCSWRGIDCVDGKVHTFIFVQTHEMVEGGKAGFVREPVLWTLDMRWLPSTLRQIHCDRVQLYHGWQPSQLPRDLRYLCLLGCFLPVDGPVPEGRYIDLSKLPEKMEALIIPGGWWSGPLVVKGLPSTMRLCHIANQELRKAYFDNTKLPASLKFFYVSAVMSKHVKIMEVNGQKLDSRITTKIIDLSDYGEAYKNLRERAGTIRNEFEEIRRMPER